MGMSILSTNTRRDQKVRKRVGSMSKKHRCPLFMTITGAVHMSHGSAMKGKKTYTEDRM